MNFGFIRTACCSPKIVVADCEYNANEIINSVLKAEENGVSILVFPELSITGYTCSDLFLQKTLIDGAKQWLCHIAEKTSSTNVLFAVGLPFAVGQALYNCAAIVFQGEIIAIIPKTNIPNYGEFYEYRQFTSAPNSEEIQYVTLTEKYSDIPFGTNIIISDNKNSNISIAVEICEDLWVPNPPSIRHAVAGATIILNLSASNEIIGKAEYRKMLVQSQSGRLACAYLYADAGNGESTTDLVFGADNIIAENGFILARSERFTEGYIIADIDTDRLIYERRRQTTYTKQPTKNYLTIEISLCDAITNKATYLCECDKSNSNPKDYNTKNSQVRYNSNCLTELYHPNPTLPFVPSSKKDRSERCKEIIALQSQGLSKRLRHTNAKSAVIGLSGGLDSTLALLVTVESFKQCKLDLQGIIAVTMPGFGTTDRTYDNSISLAKALGVTIKEIPIADAVNQHFKDIEHNSSIHDITYENSQARERTQILMDLANKYNGLVIGTGDLSELALGWATYNGDHMSMYAVNSSIPKTLVKFLVQWFADEALETVQNSNSNGSHINTSSITNTTALTNNTSLQSVLLDILDTPVSPELLPPENGNISQKTEELVGPYELHDFFMYYMLRWAFSPKKILYLAKQAFGNTDIDKQQSDGAKKQTFAEYDCVCDKSSIDKSDISPNKYTPETIEKWLKVFYRRFFAQQFKRSCLPDGAKVGTVSISPRGDWRMPSDASARLWLSELDN